MASLEKCATIRHKLAVAEMTHQAYEALPVAAAIVLALNVVSISLLIDGRPTYDRSTEGGLCRPPYKFRALGTSSRKRHRRIAAILSASIVALLRCHG